MGLTYMYIQLARVTSNGKASNCMHARGVFLILPMVLKTVKSDAVYRVSNMRDLSIVNDIVHAIKLA